MQVKQILGKYAGEIYIGYIVNYEEGKTQLVEWSSNHRLMKEEEFKRRKFNTAKLSSFMIQFSLMMADLFLKTQETANESSQ